MFGTLLQKIPEFFSIRFLFGSYLPLLITMTINLLLAWLTFWPVQQWVQGYLETEEGLLQTLIATASAIAIAVLAMVFNGFLVPLRRALEGQFSPGRRWLIGNRLQLHQAMENRLADAKKAKEQFRRTAAPFEEELKKARESGTHQQKCDYMPETTLAGLLTDAWKAAKSQDAAAVPLSNDDLRALEKRIEDALRANNTKTAVPAEKNSAKALDADHENLLALIRALERQHAMRVRIYHDEREVEFPFGEVSATRMGAVAASVEGYFEACYGMDYSIIWPRLEPVVRKESEELGSLLDSVGAQLDFYLSMLWLTVATWLPWLVTLAIDGNTPWLLLVLGSISPALAFVWWRMSVLTYGTLARHVRVAVDLHRLALFEQRGLVAPKNIEEERRFWTKESQFLGFGNPHALGYRDPA